MKRLILHFNLLNLILLAIIVIFAYYVYFDIYLLGSMSESQIEQLVAVKQEEDNDYEEEEDEEEIKIETTPLDYSIIADKNLFHPERKIPPEKKQKVELPKPEFVLYGTVITDNMKIAYVEDSKAVKTTAGRGKRQIPVKIGQSISGFILKDITQDSAVFTRGEETIVVNVLTKKKRTDSSQPAVDKRTPSIEPPQRR
ncbi:MAG TPA: hypothetical protein HPP56_04930 [Nitrospirae bacterium]|nr:hypothetical protein [Nitrospirota bacterium]